MSVMRSIHLVLRQATHRLSLHLLSCLLIVLLTYCPIALAQPQSILPALSWAQVPTDRQIEDLAKLGRSYVQGLVLRVGEARAAHVPLMTNRSTLIEYPPVDPLIRSQPLEYSTRSQPKLWSRTDLDQRYADVDRKFAASIRSTDRDLDPLRDKRARILSLHSFVTGGIRRLWELHLDDASLQIDMMRTELSLQDTERTKQFDAKIAEVTRIFATDWPKRSAEYKRLEEEHNEAYRKESQAVVAEYRSILDRLIPIRKMLIEDTHRWDTQFRSLGIGYGLVAELAMFDLRRLEPDPKAYVHLQPQSAAERFDGLTSKLSLSLKALKMIDPIVQSATRPDYLRMNKLFETPAGTVRAESTPFVRPEGKLVQLSFVRQSPTGFEQIKELVYDQPFYVEAHFDVPPTEKRKEVKLEWAVGQNRGIVVTQTEKDPKVFRSEKITPKRPALSVIPANTPAEKPSELYRIVGIAANDQLTVRSGPGANYTDVGKIPSGATGVRSLGDERWVADSTWIKISYRGVQGWVNKSFVATQ